jgi:VanZ family protein
LLLTAYIVALFGVTLAPVPGVAYPPSGFDKLVHIALFAGLAFLLAWRPNRELRPKTVVVPIVVTMLVAAMIEGVQGVLPFRNADEWDFVAGAAGALLGATCSLTLGAVERAVRSRAD